VQPVATAAPAPDNIWVLGILGSASHPTWALAHWTGRWKVVRLPAPPSGESLNGYWVGWDNAHGAWVVVDQGPTVPGWLLLHWTGRRWIKIRYPYQTFGLGPMAHDGHGGLWIASDSCRSCIYTDMVHYNPARGWAKPMPAGPVAIETMRLIPRTQSVWAAGIRSFGLHNPNGSAAILKYGP